MGIPKLSDLALLVLKIVFDRGMIGGAELVKYANLKQPGDLMIPIKELQSQDLIEVSGDISNENRLAFATFGIRPSKKGYLYSVLQQQP